MTVSQVDLDALKLLVSTQATEIAKLRAESADMKKALGDWNVPQMSRDEMTKQHDDGTVLQLPNGDNPLFWSTRWGRFAIDDAVALVGKFDGRLKAVEAKPAGNGSSVVLPVSSQDIADLLASAFNIHIGPDGRIGINGPPISDPRDGAPFKGVQLTLHSYGYLGACIAMVCHTEGKDKQRPGENVDHVATFGVGGDGTVKRGANALYRDAPLPDGSSPPWIPDPQRPTWSDGPDSKLDNDSWQSKLTEPDPAHPGYARQVSDTVPDASQPSGQRRVKAGQAAVLYLNGRDDIGTGKVILASMDPAAKLEVRQSTTGLNSIDKVVAS